MMERGWHVMAVQDSFIRYEKENWIIEASWPRRGGRDNVTSTIEVRDQGIDGGLVMAKRRINLRSGSQTKEVVASMTRSIPGRDAEAKIEKRRIDMDFQAVLANLAYWYEKGHEIETPDPTKVTGKASWLVYPVWPASGITGVAAAPGSYKSYMALAVALGLHHGTPLLQQNTTVRKARKVLYLDWEDQPDAFAERLGALQRANGLDVEAALDYKMMTIGLGDAAESIRDAVAQREYDGVVIDSMSAGISGSMTSDDDVNAFYDGIHQLEVPVFMLAHKSIEHQRKRTPRFFGSGMSEARVRMAWNAEVSEDGNFVKWECFKDNRHGLRGSKLAWEVEMVSKGEKDKRIIDRVSFTGTNPESVLIDESTGSRSGEAWHEMYHWLMAQGPQTTKDAAEHFGVSVSTVKSWMQRSKGAIYRDSAGNLAALAGAMQ